MIRASKDFRTIARSAARGLGRASMAVLYVAPLAWVACLAAFATAVAFEVGHFPRYSNPDPKHVKSLCVLYEATVILFFLAMFSPLVIGARAGVMALRSGAWSGGPWTSGIYLAGLSLAGAVVFGDAFGLMTWLLD